ncbi:hypothetical protein MCOR27_009167 [Pyricularia oryzae]|uniref:Uncharacterized protein n=4 Tax=Pyricularia TaxID=48558 RepID=A0ABQ8NA97_PYRGI|nr:uncharacterized protein MGG_14630 [Pyricularia oryzae 70-15]ELQ40571.1 hypothetical protein OOU_Y34scaffold00414g1 [Pyricularia oryzae Y34]KAI6270701.1 hypothetical protein MCOR27_009167 [Pyricularia oryzae]KAI6293833.1 hypothetical protein MCOR33_008857 [Pyricularia grisea]EHA57293.1 hypothetical protein MGG_14630 [Pyricularia oryzae 70-15]KAI6335584.1 hypothetical protein MCOR28_009624 [Pyricularia oryzae]
MASISSWGRQGLFKPTVLKAGLVPRWPRRNCRRASRVLFLRTGAEPSQAILIHFASLPEYCLILFSSQIEVIHKLHIQLQLRRLASNPWRKDSRKEF